jgi:hypothetical protein
LIATLAPAAAKHSAIARPMSRPEPVISATLPSGRNPAVVGIVTFPRLFRGIRRRLAHVRGSGFAGRVARDPLSSREREFTHAANENHRR